MLEYNDLKIFQAFSNGKTLSDIAEEFHISQPTITRCMKKLESEFGVALFKRTKNSISLNDTGKIAQQEISLYLRQADDMLERVRAYDRSKRTISIGTSAGIPLPKLVEKISLCYPELAISSELKKPDELVKGLENNTYQLIVLPFEPENPSYSYVKIGEENLMFYLPKNHKFAKRKSLTMGEMNGENMLLFSEIGFWYDITIQKMPNSRFLVQNERYSLQELIANSFLPSFVTNLSIKHFHNITNRVCVPISDKEVNVTYYLVCKLENKSRFKPLFSH